jgi:predicted Zn finger-like uncharacterized protein
MILTCPECATRYEADAAKFPAEGRKVRCAKCGNVWQQAGPAIDSGPDVIPPPADVPKPAPEEETPAEAVAAIRRSSFAPKLEPVAVEDDQARVPTKPPTPRKKSRGFARKFGAFVGWLALVGVVLVICFSAAMYRQQIVTAWPQSASLFARLGMGVNARGLDFIDVRHASQVEDGQPVLLITGQLKNIGNRIAKLPPIRVTLSDAAQHPIYAWDFLPGKNPLAPGSVIAFRTRLSNPPAAARHVDLRFANE